MKKMIALAVVSAACTTSVFAQVSNFTGPSVGANVEFKSTTLEAKGGSLDFSGLGSQNMIGTLTADYGFAIDSNKVVLIGAKFDINNTQVAKATESGRSITLEEKNHYAVFVAPGVLLSDKTLAFAKLSWETAKYSLDKGGYREETGHGIGYGVGIRAHLADNWFANIEAARIAYNAKDIGTSNMKTGSTVASFGLSYKF